jgi:DNA-binding transcriptional LysR family regulator
MIDLRRLRLLHELHARGTIAAVAAALRYTPSAVSQQLAVLEREAGVPLLEKAGRGVRLTDAAVVLARHAGTLLEQADRAAAALAAAAAGDPVGRLRIAAFQSVGLRVAAPALRTLAREAPGLRTELVEAEPEQALPALALGDLDLVLGDEWQHQPHARLAGLERQDLHRDPVRILLPASHPRVDAAGVVPLAAFAGEAWVTGHAGTGWEELVLRSCREPGGFDPDIRHRANDSVLALGLVEAGLAVTLLPALVAPAGRPGIAVREIAERAVHRTIFAATRAADAGRPSLAAVRAAIGAEAAALGWSVSRRPPG